MIAGVRHKRDGVVSGILNLPLESVSHN
jgi:hypothetical protein